MDDKSKTISGFSKLSKRGKIRWIVENFFKDPEAVARELMSYWHGDEEQQKVLDGFSENTISNFPMPYGVAPNFLIDNNTYCVPMVIEESSVVAAASSGAKFWLSRGGFRTEVIDTKKVGQVHFLWQGSYKKLNSIFPEICEKMKKDAAPITFNMEQRGGGVLDISLLDLTHLQPDYYQLKVEFETCDSMGANFINSVVESFGRSLQNFVETHAIFDDQERDLTIVMSILSNYTPDCLVKAWVECPVEKMGNCEGLNAVDFAEKFKTAVQIAELDTHRATTHNKGIFNGIDAVALATGNDFRAIEACGHAYAARKGRYSSLSTCTVENGVFRFSLEIPLALGTVGGLTRLHPIAKRSLELLGNPDARELMRIMASVGLAQNFAAVRSLITTGIQKGHMKMHLSNILNHLSASDPEIASATEFFSNREVTFTAVRNYLDGIRKENKASVS